MEIPERMKRFPLWMGKYPIHFTVAKDVNGNPVFKDVSRAKQVEAERKSLCHLCGKVLWPPQWFICDEESVEAKITNDGPMHEECARYAISDCPFLANPHYKAKREVAAGAGESVKKWLLENGVTGVNVRPARIALCSAEKHTTDFSEQYLSFRVEEWLTIDYTAVPSRSQT